jgi:hypothetical protein
MSFHDKILKRTAERLILQIHLACMPATAMVEEELQSRGHHIYIQTDSYHLSISHTAACVYVMNP